MFDLIARALAQIYNVVPNYALAIMLLTLAIMVVLTPFTLKGTRSMIAMQQLQPEIKKLQAKYKDDRQKLNEEMLAFYKEHKINPVGGCLPLLLQMPVFFVLYRVLYSLNRHQPFGHDMGALVHRAVVQGPNASYASFGDFKPKYIKPDSRMFQDLSKGHTMSSFGMDLSSSAVKTLSNGFVKALPFLVVVFIVAATSYIQQKQVSGRTSQAQVNPQQQMLLKVMPLFFGVFSLTLPGGVVLYFLVSNLYRVGQQAFITRTMYADGPAIIATSATETSGSGAEKGAEGKGVLALLGLSRESLPQPRRSVAGAVDGKKAATTASKSSDRTPVKADQTSGKAAKGRAGGSAGSPASKTPRVSNGPATKAARPSAPASIPPDAPTSKGRRKSPGTNRSQARGGSVPVTPDSSPPSSPPKVAAVGSSKSRPAAPARSAPKPPPNRSRTKKKRK